MLRVQRFEKTPAYVTRLKVELQKPECHQAAVFASVHTITLLLHTDLTSD